ncbi:Cofilin [Thelohanellus kitauei]|uniref:Cofilin n=1 Tax=Thelohanellus kitauei TaxID=669202 RepID=A0A0C2MYP4_THEKT|nr:Cofilin [Thelohanellus kitauei]
MSSGIIVNPRIKEEFESIKMQSNPQKRNRGLVIALPANKNESELTLEKVIPPSDSSNHKEDFINVLRSLPEDRAVYVVYDIFGKDINNQDQYKIILITWVPQGASLFTKIVVSSTKGTLKSALDVTSNEKTLESVDEVNYDELCTIAGIKL